MIKEFQNLRSQMIKIIEENQQLKEILARERDKRLEEKERILLEIIRELDLLEKEDQKELEKEWNDEQKKRSWIQLTKKNKRPLLNILAQNEVVEMEEFMYKLPQYVVEIPSKELPIEIKQKGYLWKGEILRKGEIL